MGFTNQDVYRNTALLQEMLTCGFDVWSWCYDGGGNLLGTNCPDDVVDKIFTHTGCKEYMLNQAAKSDAPIILSARLGLMWGAAFHKSSEGIENIYTIGPVFNTAISEEGINQALQLALSNNEIPYNWIPHFRNILVRIPAISSFSLSRRVS